MYRFVATPNPNQLPLTAHTLSTSVLLFTLSTVQPHRFFFSRHCVDRPVSYSYSDFSVVFDFSITARAFNGIVPAKVDRAREQHCLTPPAAVRPCLFFVFDARIWNAVVVVYRIDSWLCRGPCMAINDRVKPRDVRRIKSNLPFFLCSPVVQVLCSTAENGCKQPAGVWVRDANRTNIRTKFHVQRIHSWRNDRKSHLNDSFGWPMTVNRWRFAISFIKITKFE